MGNCFSSDNVDNETAKLLALIEDNLDTQSKLQFNISVSKVGEFIDDMPRAPRNFNMDVRNEKKQPQKMELVPTDETPLNMEIPTTDEDWEAAGFLEALGIHFLNGFDLIDKDDEMPEELDKMNAIAHTWIENRCKKVYKTFEPGEVGIDKHPLYTDEGTSLLAFNGAGALYTRKIKLSGDDYDEKTNSNNLMENDMKDPTVVSDEILNQMEGKAVYINDATDMHGISVRDGLEEYGAAAYFDENYELLGMYWSYGKKLLLCPNTFNKGQDIDYQQMREWEHVKWAWRVTLATQITFRDHLLTCHFVEAGSLVYSTREWLPFDHPIRRFLKPHCFRTIYINNKTTLNLTGKAQLAHRTFGFGYKRMVNDVLGGFYKNYKFTLTPDRFKNIGMDDVPDEVYPIKTDMCEFWDITREYVSSYIKLYFPTDNDVQQDQYIPGWWNKLVANTLIKCEHLVDELNLDNLINVLTQLICNGTIFHQFAGNVQEYIKYPNVIGSKIYPNAIQSNIQSWIQILTTGILTGVPMPDLKQDWTFVLLNDENIDTTKQIMNNYQNELNNLSSRIAKRNEKRRMPFTYSDPRILDVSVGI